MLKLLNERELPSWFVYPENFEKMVKNNDIDVGPWQLLHGKWLEVRNNGLKKRYPNRRLVPFARRLDSDDVACFDISIKSDCPNVIVIHDFASEGWEAREEFKTFDDWLNFSKIEPNEL